VFSGARRVVQSGDKFFSLAGTLLWISPNISAFESYHHPSFSSKVFVPSYIRSSEIFLMTIVLFPVNLDVKTDIWESEVHFVDFS